MKLHHEFDVPAAPEQALELLLDPERAVAAMPGASLVEVTGDGVWHTSLAVKLGPVSMDFLTDVRVAEGDEAGRAARLAISGRDQRGKGGAEATIDARLVPVGPGTRVTMDTDVRFSGQAAQLGRPSIIEDVSRKLVGDFAANVAAMLRSGEPPAAAPLDGVGLARAAISGAISRQFHRSDREEGGGTT